MNFASDNVWGASPKILDAIVRANAGPMPSYGADDAAKEVQRQLSAGFERDVAVFLVATGTAANALALAALTPPWGAILAHPSAHAMVDECGAPEFFTNGAKMTPVPATGAKPLAADFAAALKALPDRPVHSVIPSAITLSQVTECGLVYQASEIAAIGALARKHKLKLHMDGARFANALVAQNASPAELTWRAGVDVLSFGATKNGSLACEAVIFFNPADAETAAIRRKRSGHLLSKGRLLSAQMHAYLDGGHWLDLARHANAMAARLRDGLLRLGVKFAWPPEANELFPFLPREMEARLKSAGAVFYPWPTDSLPPDAVLQDSGQLVRLITAFATTPDLVDQFLTAARG